MMMMYIINMHMTGLRS